MKVKISSIIVFIITSLIITSCGKSDDSVPEDPTEPPTSTINFEDALLKTFTLSEINTDLVEEISIKHPKIVNGLPQNKGEIKIQLAYTEISKFSLKQADFNSSDFKISPDIGKQNIIPGQNITYTITSLKDSSVSMQYDVVINVKKLDPKNEPLSLNKVSFLKANNPSLASDADHVEIREIFHNDTNGTIVIIVPQDTDFSNLIPSIDFKGSSIKYDIGPNGDHSDFKTVNENTSIDFKYPNIVYFRIYNSDDSKFIEYRTIVDVKNPIIFDQPSVTINNGNVVSRFNTYQNVIGFTNQGNYPIEHSRIDTSEIKITETAETTPINYYTNISLRTDKKVHTGEKGRLYVQVNFPANFVGPGREGIRDYIVNATFKTMHSLGEIISFTTATSVNGTDFYIYDPVEIEVKARVYSFNK